MDLPDICLRYARIADWYAARRVTTQPLMEREYLDAVLDRLPARAPILDLGCGCGEPIAAFFLRAGHPVTGVDGAAPLLDRCRERFPDQTWLLADMRGLDLGCRFSAVIAWDSFFHLTHDDQRAMFSTFAAHLAPGGLLLFTSGPAHGAVTGRMDGLDFAHYSLSPEEYRALLARYGCTVLLHRVEDERCGRHTVWLAQRTPGTPGQ